MKKDIEASEWGTCSNCVNAYEGICNDCPDENGEVGYSTEISDLATCENWKKKEGD